MFSIVLHTLFNKTWCGHTLKLIEKCRQGRLTFCLAKLSNIVNINKVNTNQYTCIYMGLYLLVCLFIYLFIQGSLLSKNVLQ